MPIMALTPIKSAYVAQYYPNSNFSGQPELFVSRYKNSGDVYRTLLQFGFYRNLCALPHNSIIVRANLILTVMRNEVPKGAAITLSVHKMWQAWLESAVSWNTQPLFPVSPETTTRIKSGHYGPLQLDLTDLAREWKKGTQVNYGLLLVGDEERNRLIAISSGYAIQGNLIPRLQIEYKEKKHLYSCS